VAIGISGAIMSLLEIMVFMPFLNHVCKR